MEEKVSFETPEAGVRREAIRGHGHDEVRAVGGGVHRDRVAAPLDQLIGVLVRTIINLSVNFLSGGQFFYFSPPQTRQPELQSAFIWLIKQLGINFGLRWSNLPPF